ncbi:hypothetical protein ACIHEJ_32660 [Streptomyces sp. NPDC052301]|uniref:hypothetical protein n=1 Tax=Streptomyces sp. NPDC052301 TaxID=3365687 RepID=UPI0037CD0611
MGDEHRPAGAALDQAGFSVVRLTLDDVAHAEEQTVLRLGEPPSPVPEPLAELLLRWIDRRDNMNTATNHACRWLFPGRRAGQPLRPDVLAALLNDLGIPTTAGRAAAIRQHVLEMPAPVVAEALSYHRVTTAELASLNLLLRRKGTQRNLDQCPAREGEQSLAGDDRDMRQKGNGMILKP